MSKVDLRHAYRVVPIHPDCYPATGLHWTFAGDDRPTYFVDTRLPFGASMSPQIFQRLSSSVVRMMQSRGFTCISYLDDFLIIESDKQRCEEAHNTLLNLLQDLGFVVNFDKVVAPTTRLTFLGVVIDSVSRELSLPLDKLQELHSLLQIWHNKKKATKRELQHLVGKLNWAARIVRGGRTFLRHIIDLSCSLKRKHHHKRITSSAHADIAWWLQFISIFNGTVHFLHEVPVPAAIGTSDACTAGGGAVLQNDWFYVNWQVDLPSIAMQHINVKELCTIVIGARRWANLWANKHIVIFSDNSCSVHAIKKGTVRNTMAMTLLREFFWLSAVHNFHLSARFIAGKDNIISDFVSRLDEHPDWYDVLSSFNLPVFDPLRHMSCRSLCHLNAVHNTVW